MTWCKINLVGDCRSLLETERSYLLYSMVVIWVQVIRNANGSIPTVEHKSMTEVYPNN